MIFLDKKVKSLTTFMKSALQSSPTVKINLLQPESANRINSNIFSDYFGKVECKSLLKSSNQSRAYSTAEDGCQSETLVAGRLIDKQVSFGTWSYDCDGGAADSAAKRGFSENTVAETPRRSDSKSGPISLRDQYHNHAIDFSAYALERTPDNFMYTVSPIARDKQEVRIQLGVSTESPNKKNLTSDFDVLSDQKFGSGECNFDGYGRQELKLYHLHLFVTGSFLFLGLLLKKIWSYLCLRIKYTQANI